MTTELVFRVEHGKHRFGPYRPTSKATPAIGDYASSLCWKHRDRKHPGPWEDKTVRGGVVDDGETRFGFVSLKAFARWFTKSELTQLHALGYVIRAYRAPVAWEGKSGQVIFRRPKGARGRIQAFGEFLEKLSEAKKNR